MKTKLFCGEEISCLGMGNMRLPVTEDGGIDYDRAAEIIDFLYRGGVNYFDTAYVYHKGESESFLGKCMKKYPRDSFRLATKYPVFDGKAPAEVFEEQLRRLDTDYVDFYLLHAVGDSNADKYLTGGALEYFKEQKRLGRIRRLGFSFHGSLDCLRRFIAANDWDFTQIQLNYMDWTLQNGKEQYEIITEAGIPVVVMEPVRGGRLAKLTDDRESELRAVHPEWSIPSWAFRFLMRLDNVHVILSGMSTLEQADDNLATFNEGEALSDEDTGLLLDVCERYKKQVSVPCTGCRYCVDDCSMGIPIPDMMELYNKFKLNGRSALRAMEKFEVNATACVGCGACAALCPQHIDIPAVMSELAEACGNSND